MNKAPARQRVESLEIGGNPTPPEERAVIAALERLMEERHQATSTSLWLRAARSQGRRLWMMDYRDRFSRDDAWRLSARFPFGGREYSGLHGRGDAK